MSCVSCPRHCADRSKGFCGVGESILAGRIALHFGEEPVISGGGGSGTVFFSGCSLRCVFCQNRVISRDLTGKVLTEEELDGRIKRLLDAGAENINFVTPSHYALFLAHFLEKHHYPVPIIYNSSGYDSVETLEALRGKVQVFLPDLKYSDECLALRYSAAPHYVENAVRAIATMRDIARKTEINSKGLIQSGVIVRHLMLPNHLENTLGVIDAFERLNRGGDMLFSLMSQYTPQGDLNAFPELQQTIAPADYETALNYLELLGIEGFYQELESASAVYIPRFSDTLDE